jgi:hypothetical protein
MASQALKDFEILMESVDDLIGIHSRVQTGKGRRHGQEALHKAGVVLTIAAWQSYIEKLCLEALAAIETIYTNPPPQQNVAPWATSSFYFRKPAVLQSVGTLNTPNTQNVIRLLDYSFGCNPKESWVWNAPNRKWTSAQFCARTDEWLRIRHTIAHGNVLPMNLTWIKNNSGTARLKLSLLQECKRHFDKMANLTDEAMGEHLRNQYGLNVDW